MKPPEMSVNKTASSVSGKPLLLFEWQGINRQGQRMRGTCSDTDESAARNQLLQRQINVTHLRGAQSSWLRWLPSSSRRPSPVALAVFLRKMATLFAAGIPLAQAFALQSESAEDPAVEQLAANLGQQLQEGTSLAAAMATRPDCFDPVTCELIATGEHSGTLEKVLERIAVHHEAQEQLRSRLKKAVFYPSIVLGLGTIITLALLLWVVPQFASVFSSLGAELPTITQGVLHGSNFVRERGALLVLIILIPFALLGWMGKSRARAILLTGLFCFPLVGGILRTGGLAQTCRTLSTLYGAGIPLAEALDQTARTHFEPRIGHALRAAASEMRAGSSLYRVLRQSGHFPKALLGLVRIGEESGNLEHMLERAALLYQEDLDRRLDRLISLIEPATMTLLGLLIGGLVLALYLPIFQMGHAL